MATLATSRSASRRKTDNIEKPERTEAKADNSFNELRFRLSTELQTTLEIDATLRIFYEKVCSVVQCSGLSYSCAKKQTLVKFGEDDAHSAAYKVSSKDEQLGDLQFYRKHPFVETELAFLEMLIGVLFFPLRNALKYKAALQNSFTDTLTSLGNRQALELCSLREIKLAQRHQKSLSLLVIDIDHFKSVNDKHGHLAGDAVLSHIAKLISDTLRESDQVFRYGGEEFVALLSETHMDQAFQTAERIRKAVQLAPIENNKALIKITTSVGIASIAPSDDFNALFQRADDALYQAKANGRNQVCMQRTGSEIRKIA